MTPSMRWVVLVALVACGGKSEVAKREDASAARPIDAAPIAIAPKPLGMPDLDGFRWRARSGHLAFRAARTAENKEDWVTVVTECTKALAADPGHLEAAWLVAVGLAKAGKLDAVLAPLQLAVAGDFGKWGDASLELPALEPFRKSPTGVAWAAWLDDQRASYTAAIGRGAIVLAKGDLYAVDTDGHERWYRLTRTYGTVIGGLRIPAANMIVYVARIVSDQAKTKTKAITKSIGVGVINLANGHATRPIVLDTGNTGPYTIGYAGQPLTAWIGIGKVARTMLDGKLAPTKAPRVAGPAIVVTNGTVRLERGRVADIAADFDDHGLASAIKLVKTNRVVTVPSPGLIDGSTIVWSQDRSRVAFIAQLDEHCARVGAPNEQPTVAAFVADATTGSATELERAAHGLAVEFHGDALVVAGDTAVTLVDAHGAKVPLVGADALLPPRRAPPCVPAPAEPIGPPDEPIDDATDESTTPE